jgi:GNAT superfamily N-acetyltransferase
MLVKIHNSPILCAHVRHRLKPSFVIHADAAQRGRGVGRSIYSTVESWAAARGATEIRLAVLEANEAAERFWRSLGFIEYRRVGPDTFKMRSHRRIELSRRLSGATVEGSNK